jgi:hypothetical protein
MITLTARIQLFGNGSNSVKSVASTNPPNNISNSINNIKNKRIRSGNAFIIGSSKIGDGSTLSNGVDYYIGELLSDENGQFAGGSGFHFNIEPLTKLNDITIVFDDIGNGYPTELKVSAGERIYNDDPIVTLKVEALNNYITVYSWNKPKSPLIVRGVYTDVSIDLDYNNLISMSGSIFERSDYRLPNFGIISNSGNIEFNDIDGEILDYAEEGWLTGGLETKLKLTNTLAKNAQNDVGTYYTATWNYDTDNRTVSVSIKDDLEEWQDINVEGFNYDPRNPNKVLPNKTMGELYTWLWDRTPSKYKMQTLDELDEDTRTKLNSTYIEYPLLKSGNLWKQWSKFCEANQTHIYKNFEGITVCKYNGGN